MPQVQARETPRELREEGREAWDGELDEETVRTVVADAVQQTVSEIRALAAQLRPKVSFARRPTAGEALLGKLSVCLDEPAVTSYRARRTSLEEIELAQAEKVVRQAAHPWREACGRSLFLEARRCLSRGTRVTDPLPAMDESYLLVQRLFMESMRGAVIQNIRQVVDVGCLRDFLGLLAGDVTVEAAFHGTCPQLVASILREGWLSLGPVGESGLQVGAQAAIAHQHTNADPAGLRYMCVILVAGALGKESNWLRSGEYAFVNRHRMVLSHLITYELDDARKEVISSW